MSFLRFEDLGVEDMSVLRFRKQVCVLKAIDRLPLLRVRMTIQMRNKD